MAYSYESPAWKTTGEITLNPSQEGKLGIVVPDDFADWVLSSGACQNLRDGIDYDPKTGVLSGTFPVGFDMNDELTWYLVLE